MWNDYPTLDDYDESEFIIDGTVLKRYEGSSACVQIPFGVTSFGKHAFYGCNTIESVEIPTSVTSIGGDNFAFCARLKSVVIPGSIQILDNAFSDCGLTSVKICDGVNEIGPDSFKGCFSLRRVELPSSLKAISEPAFDCCSNLTDIYYAGTKSDWEALKAKRLRKRVNKYCRVHLLNGDVIKP